MGILQRLVTRTTELLVAIFSLIILSPVLLVIVLAVKISSPGPVFFLQSRKAPDGSNIYITRFRTMRTSEDDTGRPRVTAIGALLHRTNMDELPALFDILFDGRRRSLIWRRGTPRPALFSNVVQRLVRLRVGSAIGFVLIAGFYVWVQTSPQRGVVILCAICATALLLDAAIVLHRYWLRTYGDSGLELLELRDYLVHMSRRGDLHDNGGTKEFYPDNEPQTQGVGPAVTPAWG